jgi:hypothetical protein
MKLPDAAERHTDDAGVYFLVNPRLVSLRSSKPAETLLRIFVVTTQS